MGEGVPDDQGLRREHDVRHVVDERGLQVVVTPDVQVPARRKADIAIGGRHVPVAGAGVGLQEIAELEIRLHVLPPLRGSLVGHAVDRSMMRRERAGRGAVGAHDVDRARRREPVARRHERILARLVNEEIQGGDRTGGNADESRNTRGAFPAALELLAQPRQADRGQQHQSQFDDDHEARRRAKTRHARNQQIREV